MKHLLLLGLFLFMFQGTINAKTPMVQTESASNFNSVEEQLNDLWQSMYDHWSSEGYSVYPYMSWRHNMSNTEQDDCENAILTLGNNNYDGLQYALVRTKDQKNYEVMALEDTPSNIVPNKYVLVYTWKK